MYFCSGLISSIGKVCAYYRYIIVNKIAILVCSARSLITHKLSTHLVENYKTHHVINYPYGLKWYKIHVPKKRGPCHINTCADHSGMDVTEHVRNYLGPSHNFHGQQVTPKMLGFKSLKVGYINGGEYIFGENDVIRLYIEDTP